MRPLLALLVLLAACGGPRDLPASATPGTMPGGAAYPDPLRASKPPTGGFPDAALIVAIEDYERLPDRAGARAMAAAWYRYFREERGIDARRISLLRDGEATPRSVSRALERTRRRVHTDGILWVVFVGHIASPNPGVYGEMWLRGGDGTPATRAEHAYPIKDLLGRAGYGEHPRAVVVLDGCLPGARAGAGVSGTATPETPRFRISRTNAFARGLQARGWAGPRHALREPSDVAIYGAGLGVGCVEALPGGELPALSYLLLGGLRGWADGDGNGNVTAVELLRHTVRALRTAISTQPQPQPSLYGAEFTLARRVREPGPPLAQWRPPGAPEIPEATLMAEPLRYTPESMVTIAAGGFDMGCSTRGDDPHCERDEKPAYRVHVSRYAIDRHEVTWAEYQGCVGSGQCSKVDPRACFVWTGEAFERGAPLNKELIKPDHPVVCVDWLQAREYCTAVGKSLPTEAQWERAAAGTEQRRYPWGNQEPSCARAQFDGCWEHTRPVAGRPEGATPEGVHDLAGNASEWVADWYSKWTYLRPGRRDPVGPDNGQVKVVRGGSYYDGPSVLRTSYRYGLNPMSGFSTVGFRCAR